MLFSPTFSAPYFHKTHSIWPLHTQLAIISWGKPKSKPSLLQLAGYSSSSKRQTGISYNDSILRLASAFSTPGNSERRREQRLSSYLHLRRCRDMAVKPHIYNYSKRHHPQHSTSFVSAQIEETQRNTDSAKIITYRCYTRNTDTHTPAQPSAIHISYISSFDTHPKLPSFTWIGWLWPATRQPTTLHHSVGRKQTG